MTDNLSLLVTVFHFSFFHLHVLSCQKMKFSAPGEPLTSSPAETERIRITDYFLGPLAGQQL